MTGGLRPWIPLHALHYYRLLRIDTADILATQFLYGEGEDVDRAITAIYNNGGWITDEHTPDVEVIFPCLKNEGLV